MIVQAAAPEHRGSSSTHPGTKKSTVSPKGERSSVMIKETRI